MSIDIECSSCKYSLCIEFCKTQYSKTVYVDYCDKCYVSKADFTALQEEFDAFRIQADHDLSIKNKAILETIGEKELIENELEEVNKKNNALEVQNNLLEKEIADLNQSLSVYRRELPKLQDL